ncbi:hypothetical protein M8494_06065 [Serratia ureilytica]
MQIPRVNDEVVVDLSTAIRIGRSSPDAFITKPACRRALPAAATQMGFGEPLQGWHRRQRQRPAFRRQGRRRTGVDPGRTQHGHLVKNDESHSIANDHTHRVGGNQIKRVVFNQPAASKARPPR